jgi:hypothetical protein
VDQWNRAVDVGARAFEELVGVALERQMHLRDGANERRR